MIQRPRTYATELRTVELTERELADLNKTPLDRARDHARQEFQKRHGIPPESVSVTGSFASGHSVYAQTEARGRIP